MNNEGVLENLHLNDFYVQKYISGHTLRFMLFWLTVYSKAGNWMVQILKIENGGTYCF